MGWLLIFLLAVDVVYTIRTLIAPLIGCILQWTYVAYVATGFYVIFIIIGLIMLKKVIIAIKFVRLVL